MVERVSYIQKSLKAFDNGVSIFVGLGGTTEITSKSLDGSQYVNYTFVSGEEYAPFPQQECRKQPSGCGKRGR